MTLHNSLFFKNPLNYEPGRVVRAGTSDVVAEMSDNNYRTHFSEQSIVIDMRDTHGDPSRITHIFVKGRDLDYDFNPIGGTGQAFTGRVPPTEVTNYEGTDVRTTISGFQHDLYELPNPVTATSVEMDFNGANRQIHALMLLDLRWQLAANSQFTQIEFNKVDRTGDLIENPTGRTRRAPPFAGARFKWEGLYTAIFQDATLASFHAWIEENPNCAFAMEFTRYPARVFPAAFPSLRMPNGYLGKVKSQGEYVQFRIAER